MDILEDPNFKNKYQKSKFRVKRWESDFMEKYGRKPNKNDIRAADNTIKDSYKTYWKLKTQALEETLLDITFSDEAQTNSVANAALNSSSSAATPATNDFEKPSNPITNSKTIVPSPTKNSENIDPEKSAISKSDFASSVSKNETPNVDGAWGDHLNNDKEIVESATKKPLTIGRSSSFQLSQKMFSTSNLTKRNPRKSLSANKLRNPAKSESFSNSVNSMDRTSEKSDGFDVDATKPFFGGAMKIVTGETKISSQPINAIQQLIKGGTTLTNRKLNQGWLDRCSRENGVEPAIASFSKRLSGTSDSGVESMDLSNDPPHLEIPEISVNPKIDDYGKDDDDDYVCNSDSEEERRNKRVRNLKYRYSDEACQREPKRPRLNEDEDFSPNRATDDEKIVNSSSVVATKDRTIEDIVTRNDRATKEIEAATKEIAATTKLFPTISQSNIVDDAIEPITSKKIETNKIEETEMSVEEKLSVFKFVEDVESDDGGNTAKTKKTVRKTRVVRSRKGKNVESEENDEIAEKPKILRNPRVARKKKIATSENDENDDEDWKSNDKDDPSKRPKLRKTTTRSAKTKGKSENSGEAGRSRKPRAASARKTSSRRKIQNIDDDIDVENDVGEESSDVQKIPIYGIETPEVVPRFALTTNASGDLVNDFSKSIASRNSVDVAVTSKPKGPLTDREKLEAKVASGKVNENFVRINIKKKVFVRGKKNFNFSKYRKNQWKQRKKELSSGEGALDLADLAEKTGANTCFKCGGDGHYARRCTAMKSDDLLPDDGEDVSEFPTLEEAEKMALQNKLMAHSSRTNLLPKCPSLGRTPVADEKSAIAKTIGDDDQENYEKLFDDDFDDVGGTVEPSEGTVEKLKGHKIPEELLAKLLPPINGAVEPIFDAPSELPSTPDEVFRVLRMFGHENFRPGQEKAVMRILSGQSTLVTLSTGSGKSLCYQLPAYIYARKSRCITLVISPLVSLMDDQVVGVPSFLSAAALHTGQTPKVKEMIMETIKQGKLDILLVSPEAVVAGEKSTGFGALLRQLPPIAFACIDEAHCISQWSHNFRPSYLMICRVLQEKLGVKTILGLTATATKSTAESIVRHLHIRDGLAGVISDTPMPKNLTLTVSRDEQRDRAIIDLLLSDRFKECDSIIVYCTRREECTRIAGIIRISLKDPNVHDDPKAKCSDIAEAYHAGLPASRRKIIQKSFMSGKTRVVVATVAFGMGINKTNIRSVIHYNMPASFEGYVQEVGRAGRDNLPAHCHLFLAPAKDGDKFELRRHIFADSVDRHVIRRLLQKIFVPCSCPKIPDGKNGQRCPGHEVAIPVDETVRALDISEETISTLLCYLELHPRRYVTVLSSVYVNARVSSYGGPKALKVAAQSSPPLAMAIALDLKKGISHKDSSSIEFPVVDVAAAIGWDSGVVKSHLKNLEWQTVDGRSKRSAISVRYDTLGIRCRAPGDLTDAELDEALEALAERAHDQEVSALRQLDTIHAALSKYSVPSVRQCVQLNENISTKSESLKEIIREYFRSDDPLSVIEIAPQTDPTNAAEITGDVRCLISSYRDTNFTGRAVARIFHGIQSPNYPALAWSRCRYWRAHLATDFNFISRIATKEILAMR